MYINIIDCIYYYILYFHGDVHSIKLIHSHSTALISLPGHFITLGSWRHKRYKSFSLRQKSMQCRVKAKNATRTLG